MPTLIARAGAFELRQAGTPRGFLINTKGYPRNSFSVLWDGNSIAMGDHARQLKALAPHILRWAEAQLKQHAVNPLSGTNQHDNAA